MKATELMIGDWLQYNGQYNAFPFRVEQITKRKVGYHAEPCENKMHYLRLHECQPIPLTTEILEKSGFVKEILVDVWSFTTDEYKIMWPTSPDKTLAINSYFARYGLVSKQGIEYVHELQHALSLCGIEKEIIP